MAAMRIGIPEPVAPVSKAFTIATPHIKIIQNNKK